MHIRYDHNKNLFVNDAFHMTLFRVKNLSESEITQ